MSKIKICGLTRMQDVEYVNEAKPDFAGFVLSAGYRRSVDENQFAAMRRLLSDDIKAVGVFVNETADTVNRYTEQGLIDYVQLHGSEPPAYCSLIKGAQVIKAFEYAELELANISRYNTDYYLFDSGKGSGTAFNWGMIPKCDKPFFLAGGIDETNIKNAVKTVNPYCIDVSSAVEVNGYKNKNKIISIVRSVRDE